MNINIYIELKINKYELRGNKMGDDFSALDDMIYSGRGIVVGMTPSGNEFVGYSLTGRSTSSQARKLVQEEKTGVIKTAVTDSGQLEKGIPALLLYPAIILVEDIIIVGNGAQTRPICSALKSHRQSPLEDVLCDVFSKPYSEYDKNGKRWINITTYEPDTPHNTPRISACIHNRKGVMHIVRCKNGQEEQEVHSFDLEPCKGNLITTYKGGNENPLLPFSGPPLGVIINSETARDIAESVYAAIFGGKKPSDNYRVAAAIMLRNSKTKELETAIINRSERGS